jgi:hypothetical protein
MHRKLTRVLGFSHPLCEVFWLAFGYSQRLGSLLKQPDAEEL